MSAPSGRLPLGLDESILDEPPSCVPQEVSLASEMESVALSDTQASAAQLQVRLPSGASLRQALLAPYEPAALGPWSLRRAIASWLSASHRPTLARDVVAAASTSEAFSWLLKWWCAPGDAVAHMVPGYPLLAHLAEAEGLRPLAVASAPSAGRWALDLEGLQDALEQGARVVVITSPNNPTGAVIGADQGQQVAALCNRFGALCVVDEVFGPFVLHGLWPSHAMAHAERVISLGGLSKAALLPQAKLSWLHLQGSESFRQQARIHLTWLGDLYLSVSAVAAEVAQAVLPQTARLQARVCKRLRHNERWLRRTLQQTGVGTLWPIDGGFAAPVQLSPAWCAKWNIAPGGHGLARWMAAAQATLEPASLFDLPNELHAVASLVLPPRRLQAGWTRAVQAQP